MTASTQNAGSAIAILNKGITVLIKTREPLTPAVLSGFLTPLLDSVHKCFASMVAQIRFYESAKHHGRALIVRHPDGRDEVVSGMAVEALRLPLPNLEQDYVLYGRPDALRAVAAALCERGWPANGPAPLTTLARQLADAADPPTREAPPCSP